MSVKAIWNARGITIDTIDFPAASIGGITTYDLPDNFTVQRDKVDGNPHPSRTSIQGREEQIKASTLNIDDALDIIGMYAACLKGLNPDEVKFHLAKMDQCNRGPEVGNVHRNYGINFPLAEATRGLIMLESLNCDHQGDALLAFSIEAHADGQSFAIEIEENQPLSTVLDNKNRYTIGKTTIGGIELTDKKSINIASNISLQKDSADSSITPEWISVEAADPIITIRGIDPEWSAPGAIPKNGLACTHANTEIYFRRRLGTSGAGFEPDGSAVHIKITVAGLAVISTSATGSGTGGAETVLTLYPEHDGTNLPMIASTGQVIT